MASSSVSSVIAEIVAAGKQFESNEPGSREALIGLGQRLVSNLEIPSEYVQRAMWSEPATSAINRIAVDLELFQHLRDAGDKGLTLPELASKTGADVELLGRLTRHLSAMRILKQTGDDKNGDSTSTRLRGTPLTDGLAEDRFQRSIEFAFDISRPAFSAWPAFFASRGYRHDVITPTDGPFQLAHRKGEDDPAQFFPWMEANPPQLERFNNFMAAYRAGKPSWWDVEAFYPLKDRLVAGFDAKQGGETDAAFLVDVGGGRGHELDQLLSVHHDLPGRVVLQDQPAVIEAIEGKETKGFEAMIHDFFTPQPVRFARAYHMHSVLHDWDEKDSLRILENLKPALKSGYSRVLLYEIVVSEKNPALTATCMDVTMLAHLGAMERTEAQWRQLLDKAGYEILNIYSYPGVAESVIETQLVVHPN